MIAEMFAEMIAEAATSQPTRLHGLARLWFDGDVLQRFLLGPLWESRRAHMFDQFCRRS